MTRIALKIQGVADVVSDSPLSLLILTDVQERRQMTIVCNESLQYEFSIRRGKYVGKEESRKKVRETLQQSLPETLSAMIKTHTDLRLAVVIVGIFDGEYRAVIEDETAGSALPIKASEGALLCYADPDVPLYIEQSLWKRQSVPYGKEGCRGVAMPLNTLPRTMLQAVLDKAVNEENYELAQQVKDEIQRRTRV